LSNNSIQANDVRIRSTIDSPEIQYSKGKNDIECAFSQGSGVCGWVKTSILSLSDSIDQQY
jgi:hypothetical protein